MPSNLQNNEPMSATQVSEDIQCKTCANADDGTPYAERYTKGTCLAYPYPDMKPVSVLIEGKHDCIFYKER